MRVEVEGFMTFGERTNLERANMDGESASIALWAARRLGDCVIFKPW